MKDVSAQSIDFRFRMTCLIVKRLRGNKKIFLAAIGL